MTPAHHRDLIRCRRTSRLLSPRTHDWHPGAMATTTVPMSAREHRRAAAKDAARRREQARRSTP